MQIGFTFLFPAHLSRPRQKAITRVLLLFYASFSLHLSQSESVHVFFNIVQSVFLGHLLCYCLLRRYVTCDLELWPIKNSFCAFL